MKTKTKIWLGVGAFAVVGTAGTSGLAGPVVMGAQAPAAHLTDAAHRRAPPGALLLAQHGDRPQPQGAEAGEGGQKGLTNLPPELAFATRIALLRGHLLIGDELVKQQQWSAALPHFLHPTEELYADLKDKLEEYKIAPFDAALKTLSDVVKARRTADYAKAKKSVDDALAAADAAMKDRTGDWPGFVVETAVEAFKTATGDYKEAIVDGKLAKPVEYQDARGFILQGERMIESVAPDLEKKNPEALAAVRAGLAELKKAFPTAMPPRAPVKDHAAVLADVGSIELAAAKLM
jgi:hypothetical protein